MAADLVGLAPAEAEFLLDIAEEVLAAALTGRTGPSVGQADLTPALSAHRGAFVSLHINGQLNGCIGVIEAIEPLASAVRRLAVSAAFSDPRLPPLQAADWAELSIEVSVLSPLSPLAVSSRSDLLAQLRAGRDGLVVAAGRSQGLFLPKVWEQLPDPDDFLDHLWLKAGLRPRTWPPRLEVSRFDVEHHSRRVSGELA